MRHIHKAVSIGLLFDLVHLIYDEVAIHDSLGWARDLNLDGLHIGIVGRIPFEFPGSTISKSHILYAA